MIIQMPPLDRIRSAIGIEEPHALPTLEAKTGINEAVGSDAPKLSAEFPARGIVVGIKRRRMVRIAASEVMQARIDIEHDLSKLGSPPRSLLRARHESALVVDRLDSATSKAFPA